MSGVATAVVGGSIAMGLLSSGAQSDAANSAANAQNQASSASIAEQRRQFDALQQLLSPYVTAGNSSLTAQQNLLGLNGNDAQSSAISSLSNGAQMQAYTQQGENSILQNAAATGGLRGGNTQSTLAQFRPQLLAQLINQQYSNLGGLTSLGQNSAAQTGNAGMASANSISNQLTNQGNANAQNAITQGNITSNMYSNLLGSVGSLAGLF